MSVPIFIGDEVTAAGFRLAGVRVRTPAPEECEEVLLEACEEAPLIVISAAVTGYLPEGKLNECLASQKPPIVVIPDILERVEMPDLANTLRRQLGVLE